MDASAIAAPAASATALFLGPAPRDSWVDWLEARIDGLPVPAWVAWPLIAAVALVVDHGLHWIAGDVPVGTFTLANSFEVTYAPLILLTLHALDGVARRSLGRIQPALNTDPMASSAIGDALTMTPRRWANVALLAGIAYGAVSLATESATYGLGPRSAAPAWIAAFVFGASSTIAAFAFVAHVLHQLRLVAAIHRDLVRVDLFQLEPLYAFATLTSWTGIALIGVTVYGILSISAFTVGGYSPGLIDGATIIAILLVAVASFVLPLVGLHERIAVVKRARLLEADLALDRAIVEVQSRIGVGRFEQMKDASDALAASTSAVTTISRISTWPWHPSTVRGFISALGLPVVIWTITALLGRVIPR